LINHDRATRLRCFRRRDRHPRHRHHPCCHPRR
jgi:hypothetical protein